MKSSTHGEADSEWRPAIASAPASTGSSFPEKRVRLEPPFGEGDRIARVATARGCCGFPSVNTTSEIGDGERPLSPLRDA